jgi:hypothetical protein
MERWGGILILTLLALAVPAAAQIQVGNPNISRDAAICRNMTEDFKKALAGRANDPALEDAKKTGERGAYLCRFERYREGITRLEQALAALREAPSK